MVADDKWPKRRRQDDENLINFKRTNRPIGLRSVGTGYCTSDRSLAPMSNTNHSVNAIEFTKMFR